ncbi:helix-turn-helix domain-containing protein [Neobacillus sp. OS1-32]|jgi:two-component system response regulator YesN|uniref:Helix-turn-helix domain-containing protein n=1 Tax=Neobacillus paridis TaxID=2803862 RepID=A0ABS1TJW0_9BACI|nr:MULTISPECIES: helix-turn-helix domain-containing protein [Neobacillus]MBL4951610.1 helix-turn-helix domain-containing protein [Neobacillus paridis]WML28901.1 helix-turn-helix domain-containing protein [Neobacillus sp. OS1-32]
MYKLLIVDDESLIRDALKRIISEVKGITAIGEAETAESALDLYRSNKPDMMFLDSNLPGMNIYECLKQMKDYNKNCFTTLLLDFDYVNTLPKTVERMADATLIKPYSTKSIMKIVDQFLQWEMVNRHSYDKIIDKFVHSIIEEDFKSTKDQLKRIGKQLSLLYGGNLNEIRAFSVSMVEQLGIICQEKGLDIKKKIQWQEKAQNIIDLYTFEKTISNIVEEIFEEIMSTASIQEKKVIQFALNYIEKNYQKGVTLEEVSEYVHLSPFYLSKLFKKELKINFVNYVTERKIERAKELLEKTDMPVINIALSLNYQEANYFSKVFKKLVGVTPSEYRKQKEKVPSKDILLKKNAKILNNNWYI